MSHVDQMFTQLPDDLKQLALSLLNYHVHGAGPARFESATEFNAHEVTPLTFLIDGLVARGQLVILAGRPKSGKSWLVAQMAQALDSGQTFLSRPTRPARVLYMALEDKRTRLKRRALSLGWQPATTSFHYDVPRFNAPNGQLGPGLELLGQAAFDFDVILIDTLIATLDGSISENDNTAMGAIANQLATIAHAADCAIVLVHHTGKGLSDDVFNLMRGASALRGAYDVGLLLDRKQGEREAVLHIEARDFEAEGLTLRQRPAGDGWELVGAAKERERIRAGRRVIDALADFEDGATAEELAEVLNITKGNAHKQLQRAERDGYVRVIRQNHVLGRKPTMVWGLAQATEPAVAATRPAITATSAPAIPPPPPASDARPVLLAFPPQLPLEEI